MDQTNHNFSHLIKRAFSFDHCDKIVIKDPDDVIGYRKFVERLRVHIFFNGLDAEFELVRGVILIKDQILNLVEAYAYVHCDSISRTSLNGEADRVESYNGGTSS